MNDFILRESKLKVMKGISPFVSMVLVIAFGFAAMGIVLTIVNPLLDKAKDQGIINEATQNMQFIDAAIKAVASESQGSKRTIHVKITSGNLRADPVNEWVYLDFEPKTKTILDGFAGDVKIESRQIFLEYFNKFSEGSNASDVWTSVNGTWNVSSGRFLGNGGIAYHNVGNQSNFDISASIIPSTAPEGQVYVVTGDPKNLVLFLPFDGNVNTTITTAYDYASYRNNGTFRNGTTNSCAGGDCPQWVTGQFGNATKLDGINDFINITNDPSLNVTNNITIETWVNANTLSSNSSYVVSKSPDIYSLSISSGGRLLFNFTNSSGTFAGCSGGTTLSTGTWYHVAASYDNGLGIRLYVNGANETSLSGTCNSRGSVSSSVNPLYIGTFNISVNMFNGTIDEVKIWNRTLSSNEIQFTYETSTKKITTLGEIPTIGNSTNVTIVLASPGSNYFDNIKLKSGPAKIRFVVPYQVVDIENQTRFGPGDHNLIIKNDGLNTTSNRPLISITE